MTRVPYTPIKLVELSQVRPSTYNPRKADPRRLDIVELSLRKLGFVLPLFADATGELLSGHQRHHVAERMGFSWIPVAFTEAFDLAARRAINVQFNRGTNDFDVKDSSASITDRLGAMDLPGLCDAVPDKDLTKPEAWRCLVPEWAPIKPLLEANRGRWVDYANSISRELFSRGIVMPIVATRDGRVRNGLGRLQQMAERRATEVPVVYVTDEEAQLSEALLNLLSMDFDIHTRYADDLRFNSFRRSVGLRSVLGRGFLAHVWGEKLQGSEVDLTRNPDQKSEWCREHGASVVEFGGGHCTDGAALRAAGIHCASFEPYRLTDRDQIDKAKSVAQTRAWLADVASGRHYSSVFIPAVLNSVPFHKDRQHIITICAALCGPTSRLYISAVNTRDVQIQHAKGAARLDKLRTQQAGFLLDYEPNTRIGELNGKFKMQHYFTPREMGDLALERFESAKAHDLGNNTYCKAWSPRPLDREALRAALLFEFELPYPDGTRMGLGAEAVAAFERRLGL